MQLKNINQAPVSCFRWLNVNDISVEIPFLTTGKSEPVSHQLQQNEKGYTVTPYQDLLEAAYDTSTAKEVPALLKNHLNQGFTLDILPNQTVKNPIELVFYTNEENAALLDVSEIIVGENSSAEVVLLYKQENENEATARIGHLQVKAGANSRLKISKGVLLQNSIETVVVHQEENSETEIISIDFATGKNISNYNCRLEGERSKNTFKTAYLGSQNDLLDFNFVVDLVGKNTKAIMDTRGILSDTAQKNMKATLHFHQGAKGSKGAEGEYVMLISDSIKNNSIPLLLCDEDDVSGEHAAGIGRVDESTMFYLTSRGFTPEQAKNILVRGYLDPILQSIKDCAFTEEVEKEIGSRMVLE